MKQLFVVRVEIPYEKILEIGIEASSQQQAMQRARAWFEANGLDDTAETPLLMNAWQRAEGESPMVMTCRNVEGEVFPEAHASVEKEYQQESAKMACKLMIDALDGVAEGKSINMRHLAMALNAAKFAVKDQ